ncbi:hypothetical protein AMTRI_Chr09g36740 [Amborella trichopoda]
MMPFSVNYLLCCCWILTSQLEIVSISEALIYCYIVEPMKSEEQALFGTIREWIHDLAIAWDLERISEFSGPQILLVTGTWWLTLNLKTIFGGLSNMAPQSFNVIDKLYEPMFANPNRNG